MLGAHKVEQLISLFGTDPANQLEIKLRRVTPSTVPHCINFHLDHALRTMQVPLNERGQCEGGKLVFVTRQGLVWPDQAPGSATIHDNTIVHGVSSHKSGVRYGLFFLKHAPSI